ncbi:5-methylthioadenosine/S-adenosylhomocysteine deaminase [Microdochium nivale]|nr:5-methylthioadenosine/S-adenosylhomocysteine deaminase [Microdochium nivale]
MTSESFFASILATVAAAQLGCTLIRPAGTAHQDRLILQGTALTPRGALFDAHILIVNGTIASVQSQQTAFDPALSALYYQQPSPEQDLPLEAPLFGLEDIAVVRCSPDSVISPGFINTHEHIEFSTVRPLADIGERVDHRHDWRVGLRGHTARPAPVNTTAGTADDATRWGELRHLLSGTTSIVGGQMVPGLVRNLDYADGLEEPLQGELALQIYHSAPGGGRKDSNAALTDRVATWDVFPLGDALGVVRTGDCDYGLDMIDGHAVTRMHRYLAHVAEGVDETALNEFRCLSDSVYDRDPMSQDGLGIDANTNSSLPADIAKLSESNNQRAAEEDNRHAQDINSNDDEDVDSSTTHRRPARPRSSNPGTSADILGPNIGLVHALGVPVSAYPRLAARGTSVVWSPRSNVFLYGRTLDVGALLAAGVNVALGTDWLPSGSATMGREAVCACDVTRTRSLEKGGASSSGNNNTALTAKILWGMMTSNAAHVAGMRGKLGVIEVGAAADIVIFGGSGQDGHGHHSSSRTRAGKEHMAHNDDERLYARAVFAEPADIQLVLRGGTPLVLDATLQDLVLYTAAASTHMGRDGANSNIKGSASTDLSPCEEIAYSDDITKILCLASSAYSTAADAKDINNDGNDNDSGRNPSAKRRQTSKRMSYAALIRDNLARGVYPALFPRGVPDDEPSCVPTR